MEGFCAISGSLLKTQVCQTCQSSKSMLRIEVYFCGISEIWGIPYTVNITLHFSVLICAWENFNFYINQPFKVYLY